MTLPSEAWQQYVERKRGEIAAPALAVAVASQEQLLFAAVSGVRELGGNEPVEVEDKFHIGSVTKPFTATLVARLVEVGTIGWQTTPADVWPQGASSFIPELRNITVEQLLSHRAGMPAFETDEENATFPRRNESPREERARFAGWLLEREPAFPIGQHVYSNASYGLVAAMLEQVTGLSWEELMMQEVFTPLGLKSGGFGWPATVPGQPKGHRTMGDQLQPHDLSDGYSLSAAIAPAGDIHCSVTDLARFGQAHLRGLLGESGYLKQVTFKKLHDAPHGSYALGWNIQSLCSHHLGSAGTFNASLIVFPDDKLVIVIETNSGGAMTPEPFSSMASHVYHYFRTTP